MYPILFKIGPIPIYSYGIMIALSFMIGIYLARERAKIDAIDPNRVLDLGVYTLISGVVGARLVYVLANIREYLTSPLEIFMVHHGGLVFYGGLALATLTGVLFLRKKKLSILGMGDCIIPYMALGQAVARIGCLLNGCCYGKPTSLPWAIQLPGHASPLHPTQIYLSLNGLVIFLILGFIREKRVFSGQVFLAYFLLYSFSRFFIEFLRGDCPVIFAGLTPSQLASAGIFFLALAIFIKKWSKV